MVTKNKYVFGVGINDADYPVQKYKKVEGNWKRVWACPFYIKWKDMLQRCYSVKALKKCPTYEGCIVCQDWIYFSNFKAWMEAQKWEGKQLDKDILVLGNKLYSPETCVFVDDRVNTFSLDCSASRGDWPIGVNFHKASGKYQASCWSIETSKRKYLGLFNTPEEAHKRWLEFKLEQAYILASQQPDERVAAALISRYENYVIAKEKPKEDKK